MQAVRCRQGNGGLPEEDKHVVQCQSSFKCEFAHQSTHSVFFLYSMYSCNITVAFGKTAKAAVNADRVAKFDAFMKV